MSDPTKDCDLGRCPFACEGYVHVCPYKNKPAARGEDDARGTSSNPDVKALHVRESER